MSKDRTVIHKVPVYSIEGLLGLKDESLTGQNKLLQTAVIHKTDSVEQKENPSSASPGIDKLNTNGELFKYSTCHVHVMLI